MPLASCVSRSRTTRTLRMARWPPASPSRCSAKKDRRCSSEVARGRLPTNAVRRCSSASRDPAAASTLRWKRSSPWTYSVPLASETALFAASGVSKTTYALAVRFASVKCRDCADTLRTSVWLPASSTLAPAVGSERRRTLSTGPCAEKNLATALRDASFGKLPTKMVRSSFSCAAAASTGARRPAVSCCGGASSSSSSSSRRASSSASSALPVAAGMASSSSSSSSSSTAARAGACALPCACACALPCALFCAFS
mmetsp:Transcript_22130/g.78865  ORF Transcript_22130/g.78865 Transcript_22130/m.78865 type:complete len:256 (-) Transcript_22130:30-797(-)